MIKLRRSARGPLQTELLK